MTMAIIFEQVTKAIGHNIVLDHVNCEMEYRKKSRVFRELMVLARR